VAVAAALRVVVELRAVAAVEEDEVGAAVALLAAALPEVELQAVEPLAMPSRSRVRAAHRAAAVADVRAEAAEAAVDALPGSRTNSESRRISPSSR